MSEEQMTIPGTEPVVSNPPVRKMTKPAQESLKGFQSRQALDRALNTSGPVVEELDDSSGAVVNTPTQEEIHEEAMQQHRMVKVKLHAFTQFRYGTRDWKFLKDKEVLVPYFIKLHLEEKGLL